MAVYVRSPGNEHRVNSAPSGGYVAGRIENFNGKSYVLQGLQNVLEGQPATFIKNVVLEIDKTSAATSIGANVAVGYTQATQSVVAAGAGDFDLTGKTVQASGSGVATVLFRLDA